MFLHDVVDGSRQPQLLAEFRTEFSVLNGVRFGLTQIMKQRSTDDKVHVQLLTSPSGDLHSLVRNLSAVEDVLFNDAGLSEHLYIGIPHTESIGRGILATEILESLVGHALQLGNEAAYTVLQGCLNDPSMFFKCRLAYLLLERLHLSINQLFAGLCSILDQMAELPCQVIMKMRNILLHGFFAVSLPEHASKLQHPGNIVAFLLGCRVVDPLMNFSVFLAGSLILVSRCFLTSGIVFLLS